MKIDLKKAKELLRQGEIIAVPTETVFGMAADMQSEEAVLKLYNLKKRPIQKPFVIQIGDATDLLPFLNHIPFDLEKITRNFWPGPLTLVLSVSEKKVSGWVRSHLPTAAFRVSQNQQTRTLIQEYGPLVVTSANRSGEQSLLIEAEIEREFGKGFPILENNDAVLGGIDSTILAYVDASWVVLRLGAIPVKTLAQVLGYYPPVVSEFNPKTSQYTLRPQLYLMDTPYDGSIKTVLGFKGKNYSNAEKVILLGSLNKPGEISSKIFQCLKQIQQEDYPHVWVDMDFPKEGPLREIAEILERSVRVGS